MPYQLCKLTEMLTTNFTCPFYWTVFSTFFLQTISIYSKESDTFISLSSLVFPVVKEMTIHLQSNMNKKNDEILVDP